MSLSSKMSKMSSKLVALVCVWSVCSAPCVRAQHGKLTFNSDGTSGAALKFPLAGDGKNVLSAIGGAGLGADHRLSSATAGLALDNAKGHGLSVTNTHIPGFGDRLAAAGTLNLVNNDLHKLDANAFAAKNMPSIPHVPDFNSYGGGLDYMFKDKVGASLSAAHTDLINRNDYSLGGKLNLFRDSGSSLDFNAGLKKFDTPFMKSGWEPNYGLSFSKFF